MSQALRDSPTQNKDLPWAVNLFYGYQAGESFVSAQGFRRFQSSGKPIAWCSAAPTVSSRVISRPTQLLRGLIARMRVSMATR